MAHDKEDDVRFGPILVDPDHRGEAYVKTQLDNAFPRFGMTRLELGLRV